MQTNDLIIYEIQATKPIINISKANLYGNKVNKQSSGLLFIAE